MNGEKADRTMPPYFPYILAFAFYLLVAIGVSAVCGFLAIVPATRRLATRVALSMLASFPGVLLFQTLAFPFCLMPLLVPGLLLRMLGPDSAVADTSIVAAGFLAMAMFALASLIGFWVGWSVAWIASGGVGLPKAIQKHPLLGGFRSGVPRIVHEIRHRFLTLPSYEPEGD